MSTFLVFETEAQVDVAMERTHSKYKYQILDGRWIMPVPSVPPPEGLPSNTEETERLQWYEEGTKQYESLKEKTWATLNATFEKIDIICEDLKRDFTNENITMGISQMGQTQHVLDALEKVDYCMRSRSVDALPALIDAIPRSAPFLTEERLEKFKWRIIVRLSEAGVI